MKSIIFALGLMLLAASPADAGPVAAAAAAIGGAFSAITATAVGAFIVNTVLSVGLSLLARALQRKPRVEPAGVQIPATTVGENVSQTIMLGERATGGHLVYRNSFGQVGETPNAYLVEVIELSDIPGVQLRGLIIDDRPVTLAAGSGGIIRFGFRAGPVFAFVAQVNVRLNAQTLLTFNATNTLGNEFVPVGDFTLDVTSFDPFTVILRENGVPREAESATAEYILLGNQITARSTTQASFGIEIPEFRRGGQPRAWIRFYDGTQTEADPQLVQQFGNVSGYEWSPQHIGTGVAYAVLTYRYDREIFQGSPRAKFILSGIPLYDPRKDSSVGGDGPHRHGNPATWEPSNNPAVQVYNLLRGIPMPTGEIYGGGVAAADVPLANAVAGMNVCDALIDGRRQFETSAEINVAENEPAEVIEALLTGSLGQIAEFGGVWRTRFGPPAAPSFFFNAGDVSISDPQGYDPLRGLEATFNAIVTTYLEPADLWQARTTEVLRNAEWEAEDGGRLLITSLDMGAVSNRNQARQVQEALIADERRQRQHSLVLPPDAQIIDPLDDISYTDPRWGYIDKDFEAVATLFRVQTGMMQLTLRERDPDDYDWGAVDERPLPPEFVTLPVAAPQAVVGFIVTGHIVTDGVNARRPAIRLFWSPASVEDVNQVRWQVRLTSTQEVVAEGLAPFADAKVDVTSGILPGVAYEARARYVVDRPTDWTAWLGAIAPDLRLSAADLSDQILAELALINTLNQRTDEIVADIDAQVLAARLEAQDALAQARSDLEEEDTALAASIDSLQVSISGNAAAITEESVARAAADTALAAQISTVETDLGGVTAGVTQQAIAISTLEGNASALFSFRAEAGSAGAVLQLVASDSPDGPASTARIDAENILLNGTVRGAQLAFDEATFGGLRANSAWIRSAMIEDLAVDRIRIANGAVSGLAATVSAAQGSSPSGSANIFLGQHDYFFSGDTPERLIIDAIVDRASSSGSLGSGNRSSSVTISIRTEIEAINSAGEIIRTIIDTSDTVYQGVNAGSGLPPLILVAQNQARTSNAIGRDENTFRNGEHIRVRYSLIKDRGGNTINLFWNPQNIFSRMAFLFK